MHRITKIKSAWREEQVKRRELRTSREKHQEKRTKIVSHWESINSNTEIICWKLEFVWVWFEELEAIVHYFTLILHLLQFLFSGVSEKFSISTTIEQKKKTQSTYTILNLVRYRKSFFLSMKIKCWRRKIIIIYWWNSFFTNVPKKNDQRWMLVCTIFECAFIYLVWFMKRSKIFSNIMRMVEMEIAKQSNNSFIHSVVYMCPIYIYMYDAVCISNLRKSLLRDSRGKKIIETVRHSI